MGHSHEILLLIGFRGATHGKELMGDISKLFNAHLSPGTVYPALHELEAAEVLEMHKLVRTKEYTIADDATARAQIERSMAQHLAIGLFLYGSLQHV
ncbi:MULTISPECIES: helix-turn-helix transcriptional regulator [unclassified Haladaptatus]|uniref:helix-turn-helix transcriptional regulator n=1 Tax=unclassified Haladaptatus TaxID=2622732 RepID=UPI0023E7C31A|nr:MULTISPECIES: helix-turn-helix transcriptional regulator [unclassified Haladaptatus]